MPKPTPANPFYVLLLIVGVLFALTACAYFVMALRGASPELSASPHRLIAFLEKYGLTALIVELVVLAVATLGAIATDNYWERRGRTQSTKKSSEDK